MRTGSEAPRTRAAIECTRAAAPPASMGTTAAISCPASPVSMAAENQRSVRQRRRTCSWNSTRRNAATASPRLNSRPHLRSAASQLSGRSPRSGNPLNSEAAPRLNQSVATAASPAYRYGARATSLYGPGRRAGSRTVLCCGKSRRSSNCLSRTPRSLVPPLRRSETAWRPRCSPSAAVSRPHCAGAPVGSSGGGRRGQLVEKGSKNLHGAGKARRRACVRPPGHDQVFGPVRPPLEHGDVADVELAPSER